MSPDREDLLQEVARLEADLKDIQHEIEVSERMRDYSSVSDGWAEYSQVKGELERVKRFLD